MVMQSSPGDPVCVTRITALTQRSVSVGRPRFAAPEPDRNWRHVINGETVPSYLAMYSEVNGDGEASPSNPISAPTFDQRGLSIRFAANSTSSFNTCESDCG